MRNLCVVDVLLIEFIFRIPNYIVLVYTHFGAYQARVVFSLLQNSLA